MKILILSFTAAILLTACDSNKKEKNDLKDKESSEQTDSTGDNKTANEVPAETSIAGKWKPVEMNLKGMSEEEKKEMAKDIILEFTATGGYFAVNKGNRQEGTYTYDAKNKTLSIKNNANSMEVENFTIGWDGDLLLMTNDEGTVKLRREM